MKMTNSDNDNKRLKSPKVPKQKENDDGNSSYNLVGRDEGPLQYPFIIPTNFSMSKILIGVEILRSDLVLQL